jgi:predicted phage terminase large subunit-like protein
MEIEQKWRALARIDYQFYLEYTHNGNYIPAKYNKVICDKLEEVERGNCKRLMIFLPPRLGKSMTVSESFPSWFIGKNPERRVIEACYGDSLARKFGQRNKDKIVEFGKDIFDIELRYDKSSKANWELNEHRGGMIASGIGGTITGEGADLLVIDDPYKNREQADSPTYRDKIWDEWQNTLFTRLTTDGRVILIMTRWHHDDLAGRLLKKEPEKWDVINIPAIAEDEDNLLDRDIGEPICPKLGFDLDWADETKEAVGSKVWAALYQQRPSVETGDILKEHWWNYYDSLPKKFDEMIQSWDCNFKGKDGNSYVVCEIWGRKGANKYLIDMMRERLDFPALIQAFKNYTNKYPGAKAKLIEDKANGPAVIQSLENKIAGIIPISPKGSKVSRANVVSPEVESGNIYLPDPLNKPWVEDFLEECKSFPNGANDDMVDSFTQAIERLSNNKSNSLISAFRQN